MKLPSFSGMDKETALNLLLAHGDKVVVGLLSLLAAGIAWGGIDAIRLKSASTQRLPKTLTDTATQAEVHINRLEKPTDEIRVKTEPLANRVQKWQAPEIAPVASVPVFDQPLFQELAKRTKPEVFPIERLTATAGLAVLAVGDRQAEQGRPAEAAARPAAEPANPAADRRGGRRGGANPADPFGGFGEPAAPPQPGGFQPQQASMPRGKIVPFVVVTGLVPLAKQQQEYARRFSQTSYRDPKRDQPIWGEYLVEKAEVKPGGGEDTWQRIDLKAVAQRARAEWAGVQQESLPAELFMPTPGGGGSGQGGSPPPASFASYCLPLPQLAREGWGPETIHPTMLELVRNTWSKPQAAEPQRAAGFDAGGEPPAEQRPDFTSNDGDGRTGGEAGPTGVATDGRGAGPDTKEPAGPPYRLFRFIDTDVQPGRSYRYRVRLAVWNPNWKLDARHVDAAETAAPEKLASQASEPSPAATVPQSGAVLVRSLSKAEMKRFKPGVVEAIVLGESVTTGNYALRSAITEVGGLVNVDARLNKPGDTRARGEDIQTDRVVVDMRGRQADRAEERASGRSPLPPEPFELLVLNPDGSFEVASVPDSQSLIEANAATLPSIESAASAAKDAAGDRPPRGDAGPGPASPF